jgi:hypothetical protein
MKFFVPATNTPQSAEDIWEGTVKFAKQNLGWNIADRRIFRIEYSHEGKSYIAEVGQSSQVNRELVLVILESNAYLICTGNRGVLRGEPILVGKGEVRSVTEFEPANQE